jgi:hypothetical protein
MGTDLGLVCRTEAQEPGNAKSIQYNTYDHGCRKESVHIRPSKIYREFPNAGYRLGRGY